MVHHCHEMTLPLQEEPTKLLALPSIEALKEKKEKTGKNNIFYS